MGKINPTRWRDALIGLILVVVTVVPLAQVYNHNFVDFDDDRYVTSNLHVLSGLTLRNISWAFTTTEAEFWHPLTWLSLMLDTELWGTGPRGYHVTNLLLHIGSTLLLYLALKRMTGAPTRSAFVAALFAIHPLHVESVAWVSERKDSLSAFFWMLTLVAYGRYARKPGTVRYAVLILVFIAGMMAKPMLVTLPFVLLLLDYWPLERLGTTRAPRQVLRIQDRTVVLEKLPLFAMSALFCGVAIWASQGQPEWGPPFHVPLVFRIVGIPVAYVTYIRQTFWPFGLAPFYPHPGVNLSMWYAAVATVLVAAVTICAMRLARTTRYILVGWLWFLGTLLPVAGIVIIGPFSHADRFTYVPLIGLFIMIAWGIPAAVDHVRAGQAFKGGSSLRGALAASAAAWIAVLMLCAWRQAGFWRNSECLFRHTIAVGSNEAMMHNGLGISLVEQGKLDEALSHYLEAARLNPGYAPTYNNLGVVLEKQGKFDEAIEQYEKSIELAPYNATVYCNLGRVLAAQGMYDEAVAQCLKAIRVDRDCIDAHYSIGTWLAQQNRFEEAAAGFSEVLRIDPGNLQAHNDLGIVLSKLGRFEEAVSHFCEVIRLTPENADAYNNLGGLLIMQGRLPEAAALFSKALEIDPNHVNARRNLEQLKRKQAGSAQGPQ